MTAITDIAGYRFDKPSLLDEALTHPSLSGTYNYQRLEFLGDRVLGLVIATWILEEYPDEDEGQLNRRFAALVRRETLARVTRELGIQARIKMTPGAKNEGTRDKEAIQSDICEAVIGAVYLDGGFDAARDFIRGHFKGLMAEGPSVYKDAKTVLQEWTQARNAPRPSYQIVARSGPDHDPQFTIEVSVDTIGSAQAKGSAKRIAEQAAAELLLAKLTD